VEEASVRLIGCRYANVCRHRRLTQRRTV
jgi:hypothetical protein